MCPDTVYLSGCLLGAPRLTKMLQALPRKTGAVKAETVLEEQRS